MDLLIKCVLKIPSKVSEGYVRFLCPLCNEFDTAISPKTNMGRCFRCKKNFNTIEMVMMEIGMSFVESVRFLKKYNESRFLRNQGPEVTEASVQDRAKSVDGAQEGLGCDRKVNADKTAEKACGGKLVALADVIANAMPRLMEKRHAYDLREARPDCLVGSRKEIDPMKLIERIERLEDKLKQIAAIVAKIQGSKGL